MPMLEPEDFWVEASPERSWAFVFTFVFLGGIIMAVHYFYKHRLRVKREAEFSARLKTAGLDGKPEEEILRELIQRYNVVPPVQLIANLSYYDEIASQEIMRVERAQMDLADRIDRIEFLYAIRMQAFADDPSIGGVETFLRKNLPPKEEPASNIEEQSEEEPVPAFQNSAPLKASDETTAMDASQTDLSMLFADTAPSDQSPKQAD